MKKALRFLVVIGLILSMMTPLLSCSADDVQDLIDKNTKTLNTPTGLRIDSGNLCWNPVEYASRYTVSIDGAEYYCEDYKYPLTDVRNGTHTFRVKANGDGVVYASSSYSEPYTVELESGSVTYSDYYGQFDELTKNESFLGYGFDVIKSSVFSDEYVKSEFRIFDTAGLMQQRLVKVESKKSYVEEVQSSDMKQFLADWNANANVDVSWGGGSVGVEAKYSGGVENARSKYFHCISIYNQKFYIVMQSDMDTYRSILSQGFEKDLYSDMEPAELFNYYGTHFITSAIMGGKINTYYLYSSTEEQSYHDVSAKVSTEVRYLTGKTNVDVGGGYKQYANENNIFIVNNLEVIGGGDFGMLSDADIGANYSEWEASLNDHASLIGIKNTSSLVPIWNLIDASKDTRTYTWNYDGNGPYTGSRSQQLQAYFYAYGLESYTSLMEAASLPTIVMPDKITDVRVNNETSESYEYDVFAGTQNDLYFTVTPSDAPCTKTASITTTCDWARITNEKGILSLEIDTNAPVGETLDIVLSAGGVRQAIKVVVQKKYTVSFNSNGGTEVAPLKDILHGSQIDVPETPQKAGYRFIGWYKDRNFAEDSLYRFGAQAIESNLTLYAKWEPITYKANFYIEKGNLYQTQTVAYNAAPTLPEEPTKVGHTFKGWFSDAECTQVFDFSAILTADCNIYAKWSPNTYTVTFEPNGGSEVAQQTVAYGEKVKRPATVKEGATLAGWYTDAACATLFDFSQDVVTGNMTLYAKWTANPVTVSFDCMGGEPVDDRTTEQGSALGNMMPVPVRLGYTFAGWYTEQTGGTRFYATDAVAGSITLYARWTANTYTVTFDGNGGTPSTAALTCVYGNAYGDLPDASRTGYTFAGWYLGSTKITSGTILTTANDHVLEAMWISNSYTVSLDVSSSTIKTVPSLDMNSLDITYGAIIKLPVPTANYYDFIGWYLDEEGHVQFTDSEGNMLNAWDRDENQTLYAQWKKAEEYKDYEYINSKEELINISPTGNTLLVADIDMENYEWNIIETFSGKLDGAGNMISNLVIKSTSVQYLGLFAQNSGCIENIVFNGIQVSYSVSDSYYNAYIGIIAGFNTGTIKECVIRSSTITCWLYKNVGTSSVIKVSVGGIAGRNEKVIYECSVQDTKILGESSIGVSDGKVEANSGGIVGMNLGNGTIENCSSESNTIESVVHGGKTWTATRYKTYARAGGIVGYNEASVIACNVSDNALRADYSTVQGSYPDNYNSTGDIAGKNNGTIS